MATVSSPEIVKDILRSMGKNAWGSEIDWNEVVSMTYLIIIAAIGWGISYYWYKESKLWQRNANMALKDLEIHQRNACMKDLE